MRDIISEQAAAKTSFRQRRVTQLLEMYSRSAGKTKHRQARAQSPQGMLKAVVNRQRHAHSRSRLRPSCTCLIVLLPCIATSRGAWLDW